MQLHGTSVKQARLSEDLQSCSDGLSKYLCEIIFLLMGRIYSINCIQLVLREAFFNGGQLSFVSLELCPSSELLPNLSAWSWLLSTFGFCLDGNQPSEGGFLHGASLAALPTPIPNPRACRPAPSDWSLWGNFLVIGKHSNSRVWLSFSPRPANQSRCNANAGSCGLLWILEKIKFTCLAPPGHWGLMVDDRRLAQKPGPRVKHFHPPPV